MSTTIAISPKPTSPATAYPCVASQTEWTQVISTEYKNFAPAYGFERITTSSYWPCSNGEAEVAVNEAKTVLNKPDDLYMALLKIRTHHPVVTPTPHCNDSWGDALVLYILSQTTYSNLSVQTSPPYPLRTCRRGIKIPISKYDMHVQPLIAILGDLLIALRRHYFVIMTT